MDYGIMHLAKTRVRARKFINPTEQDKKASYQLFFPVLPPFLEELRASDL